VIERYEEGKERAARRDYFDRLLQPDNRSGFGLEVGGGGNILQGDVQGSSFNPSGTLALRQPLSPRWALGLTNTVGRVGAAGDFGELVLASELDVTYYFAPRARFTPFLRAAGGVVTQFPEPYRLTNTASILGGGSFGVEYMVNADLGLNAAFDVRYTADDALDNEEVGRFNDSLWGGSAGLTYYF
jgi:curli production assembly/transport component CsgG